MPERENSCCESQSELLAEWLKDLGFHFSHKPSLCHSCPRGFSLRVASFMPSMVFRDGSAFFQEASSPLPDVKGHRAPERSPEGDPAPINTAAAAQSPEILRMSQSWPRSSLLWFMNLIALSLILSNVSEDRRSPLVKPLGRITTSLHPRSAFSVAAHYSKGDKSKHRLGFTLPSCPILLNPVTLLQIPLRL